MIKRLIVFLKGLCIGGTMTVPGVSGGSMAIILGIYDKLLSSVNGVLKLDKKSICFLLECVAGALVGIFLFSKSLLALLTHFPMPTSYFFLGAIVGSIPMIYRSAKVTKFTPGSVLYPILGILLVSLIALIPTGLFSPENNHGAGGFFIQILGGVIIAIALVLPGISVSQMLLMLGLYEIVMGTFSSPNVMSLISLIPLAIGLLVGTLSTTNILDKAMKRFPQASYLIILGFVLGSVGELFPGIPTGADIPISIAAAAAGMVIVYIISSKTAGFED